MILTYQPASEPLHIAVEWFTAHCCKVLILELRAAPIGTAVLKDAGFSLTSDAGPQVRGFALGLSF